jgi:hypothetical protein
MSVSVLNTDAGLSGKTLVTAEGTVTITAQHTYDRDPSAPYVVTSGSAKVDNLDSDKLDGQEGSYYLDLANATGSVANNLVMSGPSTGGPSTPSFRALLAVDLASIFLNGGIYHSTTQSLTNSTETAVLFDTEDFDTGTMHDTGSNTSRITNGTGLTIKLLLTATVSFASNATGSRAIRFRKGGSTAVSGWSRTTGLSGDPSDVTLSAIVSLAASEYVELIAIQSSGGALNIGSATRQFASSVQWTRIA